MCPILTKCAIMRFKTLLLVIGSLWLASANIAATKRALVIGIGSYPTSGGWSPINGDKDIPIVENILLANGFQKKDIVKLQNEKATFASICSEMESLISRAKTGDFIYIHFSGHGQQISDQNGDETDGFDEAWIPYDAPQAYTAGKYEGQRHITDDHLNHWLHRLRTHIGPTGMLIVVADACHSGDGTRDTEEEEEEQIVIRGTSDKFIIPTATSQPAEEMYPVEWISISACKPYQCNYEYKGMGSLTYAIYQEREQLQNLTAKQLHSRIRTHISEVVPKTQTPVVDMPEQYRDEILF